VHYEFVTITANPPGSGSDPVAILLIALTNDRLAAKVRDDLGLILDVYSAEIVTATIDMCVQRAAVIGGLALLGELEDTLSNFLTIGPRSMISAADDPDTTLSEIACAKFPRRG